MAVEGSGTMRRKEVREERREAGQEVIGVEGEAEAEPGAEEVDEEVPVVEERFRFFGDWGWTAGLAAGVVVVVFGVEVVKAVGEGVGGSSFEDFYREKKGGKKG